MTILAVVQMAMGEDRKSNVAKAKEFIYEAASTGARIVLLPELFEGHYFCQVEREEFFPLAHPVESHPFLPSFQELAKKLGVVLPISFFERAGQAYFNSLALIDADGTLRGVYRKSHIPDGPGYEEKFYFNPGDTGFAPHQTTFGCVGGAICWDQWFPECARVLVLQGANLLLYPTAIGSEPAETGGLDTRKMWQRAMIGHAVSNSVYVAAANRVGTEQVLGHTQSYYGHSFVADYTGEILCEAGTNEEKILFADLDMEKAQSFRASMGFFRDRRPELYSSLVTLDGKVKA